MFTLGCHLSTEEGYLHMAKEAVSINANTFQFFTRNPRGGRAKALDPKDIEGFRAYATEHGIEVIMGYAPYTMNPATDHQSEHDFTMMVLAEDLARMEETPHMLYTLQPGSALGSPVDDALANVADALNEAVTPSQTTRVLLETMSGSGTEVGSTFEQMAAILAKVTLHDHVGVCFDACRVWGAGYDIVDDLDDIIDKFDRTIGLDNLHAIHLNDSQDACGSHADRHAPIGEGQIGFDALAALTNHPKLLNIPFYLEAPHPTVSKYGRVIEKLRQAHAKG